MSDMTATTIIKRLCQLFAIFGMPSFIHSDRGSSFMSEALRQFLLGRGIATSRTTPYNPQGNGQVERYNGIIWRAVSLALKTRNLSTADWEYVLPDALHSIRSLLSAATNCTPHERLFCYQRKSSCGRSIPTWLVSPGKALYKRQVRQSKYDPLVDEVELSDVNTNYAHVRFQDGKETTVSLRHLAPAGDTGVTQPAQVQPAPVQVDEDSAAERPAAPDDPPATSLDPGPGGPPAGLAVDPSPGGAEEPVAAPSPQSARPPATVPSPRPARSSGRTRRPPAYLSDYYV